ncbi:peptidylprolyl isomerase [Hyunsoonleella pacifica]|uniref:PpiC domain-containing protein n=1 Tax=Hyunsoonleella pacifica TaxID=1080224 RepID=A0A4Q9FV63_9FLAO|nr:peptidylprolyl isomerase [Hyunsoonleella pacifica]TBN17919.1 hypothetical protein EYD46_06330 [Hyunsoonleella pacifica]GGD07813.1 hypothetical protein GCM10011368_07180 [Hyunsoonleella pacifica]
MKQHLLFTFSFLFTISLLSAQDETEEALASIETQEQAKQFIKDKYAFNSKIFTFNEEKHKSQLAKALFKLEKGNVKTEKSAYEKVLYKIIEKNTNAYYRVAYIFLDGNAYSLESINKLREILIKKYNNGIPFSALANQYSMDQNRKKGGDTGWFTVGSMPTELEDAIISDNHALEDVYIVDIPSKQWYYLVFQSHEPKDISEIKVLKIVEPLE